MQGVIVARVDPTGAARQVLRRGFVILEVNREPTPTVAEYQRIVGAARAGDVLAIYYYDPTRRPALAGDGRRRLIARAHFDESTHPGHR